MGLDVHLFQLYLHMSLLLRHLQHSHRICEDGQLVRGLLQLVCQLREQGIFRDRAELVARAAAVVDEQQGSTKPFFKEKTKDAVLASTSFYRVSHRSFNRICFRACSDQNEGTARRAESRYGYEAGTSRQRMLSYASS